MALTQPVITSNNGQSYATNRPTVRLQGTADPNSTEVRVNGSTALVEYTPGAGSWTAGPFDLVDGPNVFVFQTANSVDTSPTATITVSLLTNAALALVLAPPSGLQIERGRTSIRLTWQDDVEQEVRGYRVYVAREPGGGLAGYIEAHAELITDPAETVERTQTVSREVSESGNQRTTTTIEAVYTQSTFEFILTTDPTTGQAIDSDPYYFVVAAVGYDETRRREIESPYSLELHGQRLDFTPRLTTFDNRGFGDIVTAMVQKVFVRQPDLDTKPLTFARDVVIDPTADEFARLYAVLNFVHASQSLQTLLAFDDPNGDGESDDFTPGLAKTKLRDALALDNATTQLLIDSAFETKAVDYSAAGRSAAAFARGQVTFYSTDPNLRAVTINKGTVVSTTERAEVGVAAVEFETTTGLTVSTAELSSYYHAARRRYEFTVPVQARTAGADGNVPANSIINAAGVPAAIRVTNFSRTDFGRDRESNADLALRALLGVAGVDSGTRYGYYRQAAAVPGVRRVNVVDAGHPLMVRDFDEVRKKHVGGAVDVFVQGTYLTQVEYTFAFQYPLVTQETAEVVDLSLLRFRVTNPAVTALTPAFELVAVRNVTKALDFAVSGASIDFGTTFQLDPAAGVNAINRDLSGPADVFVLSYRFRQSSRVTPDQQPVLDVVAVNGSISGDLSANYNLYRLADPLLYGYSPLAGDEIEIFPANDLPAAEFVSATDTLRLYGLNAVSLSKLGVLEDTIVVTNSDGSVTYVRDIDYAVTPGSTTAAPRIQRLSTESLIADGAAVQVTYQHGENVTVQYLTNSLLHSVDARINGTADADYLDASRHAAADVLVKSVLETPVDVRVRLTVRPGFIESDVRDEVVAAVTQLIDGLQVGEPLNQDRVIDVVRGAAGINRVEVPLAKLTRQDASLVVRETLPAGTVFEVVQVGVVAAYRTVDPVLQWPTLDGGGRQIAIAVGAGSIYGPITAFEDALFELTAVDSISAVTEAAGRVFIGGDGRVTLSPVQDAVPGDHSYQVSYRVFGASGAVDLAAGDLEVFRPGEISVEVV